MQRSLTLALILVLAAAAGALWYFFGRGTVAPPPAPGPVVETPAAGDPVTAPATGGVDGTGPIGTVREAVATRGDVLLDDPDIRAALCGFKGRVVDHLKVPVADCGVRIYRGALDSVLQVRADLFAEAQEYEPQYIAGEVRTGDDGTWQITGVWPRGFYLLFAGIGTDAPTHQIITKTPGPGQIVDLGDVVLNDAGVITGTVLDDDGEPLAGALVRAADVPGAVAAFFPIERIDPKGALLIREPDVPVRVVRFPTWVERAFENLPIPSIRTAPDGTFRLVGVMPGSNMLATTADGFLSDVKPSVQVRAGRERNVGTIRMRRGEELSAKVIDAKGEAIADAEVLAGSTLSIAPVDLAQAVGTSDADGKVRGTGFSPGKVTVAARRSSKHAWVIADPQPILGEVTVTLPATFSVTASVLLADGSMAPSPRFKLLRGRAGNGTAEMYMMGISDAVDLDGRQKQLEDGRWQIDDLNAGPYTLLADVPGQAVGFASFDLTDGDATVSLQLAAPKVFRVRAVDLEDRPIKNVAVFAEGRGERLVNMPIRCGRTDVDGTLVIDKVQADEVRVSGEHPRWGVVHGECKEGQEVVLRFVPPGALLGELREDGKPPKPGAYTVAVMLRRGSGPRGPLEQVPSLLTAGLDGKFRVDALQPGNYSVVAMSSLDAMRSPGGVFSFAQTMFIESRMPQERVEVVSGQTTEVVLELGEEPLEGPTAQLTGSVTVDGKLAEGYTVTAQVEGRRFAARVDERGRFDLGTISAGRAWVSVMGSEGGVFLGPGSSLWSSPIELAQGELRELTVDIMTSSLGGACFLPDGSPAANVFVQARGKLEGSGERGDVWLSASTDANGVFRLRQVPAGAWQLEVRSRNGDDRWRGKIEGVQVTGGVPVEGLRLDLIAAMTVKGRIDMSSLGAQKPRWSWVAFHRLEPTDAPGSGGSYTEGVGVNRDDGAFMTDDLPPGRYRVVMHTGGDNRNDQYECGTIDVPAEGLRDVVLVPRAR